MSSFAVFFAQVSNAASAVSAGTAGTGGTDTAVANYPQQPWWVLPAYMVLFGSIIYFGLIRPQMQASKKKEETVKTAKTGDKIITSSGIHGVITNVKDSTVIVRVADNVKLEIEKTHIEKITRPESSDSDKPAAAAKA